MLKQAYFVLAIGWGLVALGVTFSDGILSGAEGAPSPGVVIFFALGPLVAWPVGAVLIRFVVTGQFRRRPPR